MSVCMQISYSLIYHCPIAEHPIDMALGAHLDCSGLVFHQTFMLVYFFNIS